MMSLIKWFRVASQRYERNTVKLTYSVSPRVTPPSGRDTSESRGIKGTCSVFNFKAEKEHANPTTYLSISITMARNFLSHTATGGPFHVECHLIRMALPGMTRLALVLYKG